jgi:hypothetical protein
LSQQVTPAVADFAIDGTNLNNHAKGKCRMILDWPPPSGNLCRGSLLSRSQYLVDLKPWGYEDPRLKPHGTLSPAEVARWTAAIDQPEILPPNQPANPPLGLR